MPIVVEDALTETEFRTEPAPVIEEERPDLSKIPQRRPPKDGPCKRCGQDKPLNRLFLCYPCWVKTVLEEKGWNEGTPHPHGCDCELPASHGRPLS